MAKNVVVRGLQELSKQFDRVVKEVDGGCKKFMRKVTREVAAGAKRAAPVGRGSIFFNEETGQDEVAHYRDSIKWTMSRNGLYGWAYAGKKGKTKRGYLGHLLEYGTVKTKAYPHFGPALDRVKAQFEPGLKAVIAAVKGGRV